ncbi:HAD-IA family hydrolase [Bradyrhizobium icense]|uniref:HAD-IA family hydrolase n=1 Tax=Bradyrhizobium icense TaxID=1274631 RepID=UPI003AAB896C
MSIWQAIDFRRGLAAQSRFQLTCCLSNDVSEWSVKLRDRHGLNRWISHWFISGDLKSRKPNPEIYRALCAQLGISADRILFADDRVGNLEAARAWVWYGSCLRLQDRFQRPSSGRKHPPSCSHS